MNDFSIFKKFTTTDNSIYIEFSKKLNKKERDFFNIVDLKLPKLITTKDFLCKIFDLKKESSSEELQNALTRLSHKEIIITSKSLNFYYKLKPISSFFMFNETISINFSPEIYCSFHTKNDLEILNLNKILKFKEKYSYRLFQHLKTIKNESLYIEIETLRSIFEIENSYDRFFDIEKNLLKPILKDLETIANLNLTYDKVKNGVNKNSKILGLTFKKINLKISSPKESEPVYRSTKLFKNLFELHTEILNIFKKFKDEESYNYGYYFNSKLLIKIYNLKNNDTFLYEEKNMTIRIHYQKDDLSTLEIFLKK
ncbi:replication initiation protein [Cetobacterium sp. 8H]|uniref:replication initiation protein n=1 Tax=Cetobacterium sp. 8H TaxID=2759681 RepID=UPI00163BF649|nr:replication initiation protein [Cetobacterium sp. 8H]MBC2851481.1 replication initiation protein [Cetobacterium sp. 8H]